MFLDEIVRTLHHTIYRYPKVLNYLKSREVTDEDIKTYELGYNKIVRVPEDPSPDRIDFMDECRKGRKLEDKLIFPFKDISGSVVGLVGRSIDTKEFKVFVTSEAKFKGFFFGLQQALPHIYRTQRVFIVEGCFDQLAFSKVFPNTVATLTAGLSDAQYDLLMLYTGNGKIFTVFDSDKTGIYGRKKAVKFRENIIGVDFQIGDSLGFKDPAKWLEELKLTRFREVVRKRVEGIMGL
jgi:DNA primase